MEVGFVCCGGANRLYAECIQHAGEPPMPVDGSAPYGDSWQRPGTEGPSDHHRASGMSQSYGVEEDARLLRVIQNRGHPFTRDHSFQSHRIVGGQMWHI